jgi:hypothetical protein
MEEDDDEVQIVGVNKSLQGQQIVNTNTPLYNQIPQVMTRSALQQQRREWEEQTRKE